MKVIPLAQRSSDVRHWASFYIGKGWQVVPLKPGTKAPYVEGWPALVHKPEDFQPGDNIGIKSVGGIVVIDIDSPEAIACADAFLPETGAIYGRLSKPRSKRLYVSFQPDGKTPAFDAVTKFTDQKKVLLELRANHQDVAPGSRHESGEWVEWVSAHPLPAVVEAELLRRCVRLNASCALVSRYYADQGSRHEWCLALAGALKRLGLTVDEAGRVIEHAGRWAHDAKLDDRQREVRSTFERTDAPVSGFTTLQQLAGKHFVASLQGIWGTSAKVHVTEEEIAALNAKHALIFQQAGDFVLITEESDGLRFSKPDVMSLLYPRMVAHGKTEKPLGQVWLRHADRRFFNGIELAPHGRGRPDYYNLWQGFSVEPKKGDWPLFREHINLVAGDNADYAQYILCWMAETIQHPEEPIGVALALRGAPGTGKTTFATWFGELFGVHFLHLEKTGQLTGRFNAHLRNAIFVFADEAAWSDDKASVGALRRMVTDKTLFIEPKHVNGLTLKNHVHLVIASNNKLVVPRQLKDRRFTTFDVSNGRKNDRAFFTAVKKELDEGGLAALLYDLLAWNIDVNPRQIIETAAGDEQKEQSIDPLESWWVEKLRVGQLLHDGWPDTVQYALLHLDYIEFVRTHYPGDRSPKSTQSQLGAFLRIYAPGKKERTMFEGDRQMFRHMPPLEECRATWVKEGQLSPDYRWDVEEE